MRSGIRPLRRFSQNFLTDPIFARRLVEAAGFRPEDAVLEIGPGEGILTQCLLESPAGRVVAVEIDRRCADFLRSRFAGEKRFRLIEEDFLKTELPEPDPPGGKWRVVGNIPYAITSPILFRLLDIRSSISDFTLTVQKEVAQRVASPPGTKAYGIPSVLLKQHAEVRLLFTIPPGAFRPVPRVDSAVVHGRFLDQPKYTVDNEAFFRRIVKTAFGQRRKMLHNTLKPYLPGAAAPSGLEEFLKRRPESVSVEEWAMLANRLHEIR